MNKTCFFGGSAVFPRKIENLRTLILRTRDNRKDRKINTPAKFCRVTVFKYPGKSGVHNSSDFIISLGTSVTGTGISLEN
jgi:hypothetical protein